MSLLLFYKHLWTTADLGGKVVMTIASLAIGSVVVDFFHWAICRSLRVGKGKAS
jgi:hypothetical protein